MPHLRVVAHNMMHPMELLTRHQHMEERPTPPHLIMGDLMLAPNPMAGDLTVVEANPMAAGTVNG